MENKQFQKGYKEDSKFVPNMGSEKKDKAPCHNSNAKMGKFDSLMGTPVKGNPANAMPSESVQEEMFIP